MLEQQSLLRPGLSIYQDVCVSSEVLLLSRLKDMIELHFRVYKTTDYYCRTLGYTVRGLNAIAVFHTGKTVYEMIQERLLVEAKRLMVYSRLSVKRIAYELGFGRHDYFSRWFKKMTGYTAKAFRREMMNNTTNIINGNQYK